MWQEIAQFFSENGWKIAGIAALLILGGIAIKITAVVMKRIFKRKNVEQIAASFIISVTTAILVIILTVAVIGLTGISTAPFVAVLGTAGLALALSLQDSLGNLFSGVVIIITKPFKKGDYVEIGGVEGSVERINMLTTRLITFDNKDIVLPNSTVAKSVITNFTSEKLRRLDMKFSAAYGSDLDKVTAALSSVCLNHSKILKEPAPIIRLAEYGESALIFAFKVWTAAEDYWTVFYDIQEQVYKTFARENIEIPYSKLDVHITGKDETKII